MKHFYMILCTLLSYSVFAQVNPELKEEVRDLKKRILILENDSNINKKKAWKLFYESYGESVVSRRLRQNKKDKKEKERNLYHKGSVNLYVNTMLDNYTDVKVVKDAYFELNSAESSFDLGINTSITNLDSKDFMRWSLYTGIKIEQEKKNDAFNFFKNGEGIGQVSGNIEFNYFVKGNVDKEESLTNQVEYYFKTANFSGLSNKEIKAKLIEREVELLDSNHIVMSKHWFSVNLKLPFRQREYEFYNNVVDFEEVINKSYNWNAQFKYNYFRRGNCIYDHNLLLSMAYSAYRDNSVMNKDLSEGTFLKMGTLSSGIVPVEELKRYVGEYEYYINHRVMSELTVLFKLKHFYIGDIPTKFGRKS